MFRRANVFAFVVLASLIFICLSAAAQPLAHAWSQCYGDTSYQYSESVAVDGEGNSIVTGRFQGTVDFGGGALTSAGGYDIYLAKFDALGTHMWSKRFGDASDQLGFSVVVDGEGNSIVTGWFQGTADFGGGALTSAGDYDVFLAKFDASGTHLWSKRFGDAYDQSGFGVAVDGTGKIIVTGCFDGTVDFGGGALTSAELYDIFLAKFDAAGTHLWSRRFDNSEGLYQIGRSVAVDGIGNIVVTGDFDGAVDFGGGPLTSAGILDIFLAKFDASGTHLWSKRFGDAEDFQYGMSVSVDSEGDIVMTGYFAGTADFGGGVLSSAGLVDIFLAEFNGAGTHLWSQRFGDTSNDVGHSVSVDGIGNIVVTGYFNGTVDFGGGALTSAGGTDIFLANFDASGTHLWSRRFGDASTQRGYSVAVDGMGKIIVTGFFRGTVDFGGGVLTSAGNSDIFLAKFLRAAPEPEILAISDIPNDQGKQVRISWLGSAWDYTGSPMPITDYSIYRKIDYDLASSRLSALSDHGAPLRAYPPGDWDFIASIPASGDASYSAIVATLADSTIFEGMYHTTFFVSALTDTPGVYYDSPSDSGYSVDNLEPAAPENLIVTYNTGSGNHLSWDESEEADFKFFCIYRDTVPDFVTVPYKRVHITIATEWTDPEYDEGGVYYKVTAVDFSGNESYRSEWTGTDGPAAPAAPSLYQNVPNPFNPRTIISFDLKKEADVSLAVYDVSGRLVRVLVSGRLQAQRYQAVWDGTDAHGRPVASGVYFYCLTAGTFSQTRKMVLLR